MLRQIRSDFVQIFGCFVHVQISGYFDYGLVEKSFPVNKMNLKSFNPFHVIGPSLNLLKTLDYRKKQVP